MVQNVRGCLNFLRRRLVNSHGMARTRLHGNLSGRCGLVVALACVAALGDTGCGKSPGKSPDSGAGGSDTKPTTVGDAGYADSLAADHPADTKVACSSDAGAKSKGTAEACTCDSECRTGFCVDGVCCNTACTDTCKACNLPSALGECSSIPAGVSPRDPLECPADQARTCGRDGTCNGAGACRKYVDGIVCQPGICAGDSVAGALTCDGQGLCSKSATTPCYPYSCDPTTNLCATECTDNGQCASGQSCFAQSCGKKLNGAAAKIAIECLSTYVADGVCCNVPCSGPCVSCKEPGFNGRCKFLDFGLLDPACPAKAPSTCGTTGRCDGSGACAIYPANTPCGSASCSGGVLSETAPACDGKGTCQPAQIVDCSPYLCSGGACNGSCSSDNDCEPGHACVATQVRGLSTGACGKKKNGQSCTDLGECESSQCVDGYCCESSCEGACRSCGLPGSLGQCVNVAAGGADPRDTCVDNGKASCATNGMCDGTGACQKYPVGFTCGQDTCVLGAHTPPATCNASGQCVAPPSQTCNPYVCNGQVCYNTCTSDNAQCIPGRFCVNGSCGLKPIGAECSTGNECQLGYCAQGVCCNSGCTGACLACNLSASLGLCTAVADNAPDPQGLCTVTAAATCGTTGQCKSGKCSYVAEGYNCKGTSCASSSSQTPASTCDGQGTCVTPPDHSCGTFICSSAACESVCKTDSDCAAPNTCANNSCGLKPSGSACTAGPECSSGFCTEKVCCNTACSDATTGGLCVSFKVPGKVGTCSPVPAGGADPKKLCTASNALAGDCSNDGTCNGANACRPWSTATGCRLASCTGSTLTPSANCDGSGHCPAATTQGCSPYQCAATSPSCLTTCTLDSNCTGGLTCIKQNNQCGTKLAPGQNCKADSDCDTTQGNYVCSAEGVCCTSACSGACQSCVLSGKLGTCSNIAASVTPRDTTTCVVSPPCGHNGMCDGNSNCQFFSSSTICIAASCAPAVSGELLSRIPVRNCDGAGNCAPADAVLCDAFQCNANTGQCKTACTVASVASDCNTLSSSSGGYSCIVSSGASQGICQREPNGSPCANGFACSSGNCVGGICCGAGSCAIDGACYVNGTINSANACLQCASASPTAWSPVANGTACNDANACTQTDACQAGVCTGSNPVVCAVDQCHTAGTCNTSTGVCSAPPSKADGTACNDGNACTQTDTCQAGVCTGSNPIVCAADQCHTVGTCNTGTGVCSAPSSKADGTACNDGNACTQTDKCQVGVCTGSNPVVCVASDQCHAAGTCDTGTGVCSHPSKTDGTACNDGNACTQADTCQVGTCTGANPVVCTAKDQCHAVGTCDPGTGTCSNPGKADGTSCDDGNASTVGDVCTNGICSGVDHCAGVTCPTPDQCHAVGICDHGTGTCSNPIKADGTGCDDGNASTVGDACTSGICVGVDHCLGVICPVPDQCHDVGVCNHGTGTCSNPIKADGTGCDDGNASTVGDVCTSGICGGVDHCVGVICPVPDQCHDVGVCNHGTGTCSSPIKADGTGCDDGNVSTVGDACTNGICAGVDHCVGVICAVPDQCHDVGACNHGTGACSNPEKANGTGCDDGNANTVGDACTNGICAGIDHCVGVTCPAPDQCHDVGTCEHSTGLCSNPPLNNTPCTYGTCSNLGTCQAGTCMPPAVCS